MLREERGLSAQKTQEEEPGEHLLAPRRRPSRASQPLWRRLDPRRAAHTPVGSGQGHREHDARERPAPEEGFEAEAAALRRVFHRRRPACARSARKVRSMSATKKTAFGRTRRRTFTGGPSFVGASFRSSERLRLRLPRHFDRGLREDPVREPPRGGGGQHPPAHDGGRKPKRKPEDRAAGFKKQKKASPEPEERGDGRGQRRPGLAVRGT